MSTSTASGSPNHERSQSSSGYPLDFLTSESVQNHTLSENDNSGLDSTPLSLDMHHSHRPGAQEEGLLTGQTNRRSPHNRPKSLGLDAVQTLLRYIQGSRAPRLFKIDPVLPQLQKFPEAILHRFFPKQHHRSWLFAALHLFLPFCFILILSYSIVGCRVSGETPVRLSCVSRLWRSTTFCGVDGANCRPFDDKTFEFRCPSGCGDVIISTPETIGDTEYNYQTIVVGGSSSGVHSDLSVYRGDSFICGAAIHAGITTDHKGGGGIISLLGEQDGFPAVEANGISSLNFTPSFPLSFTFERDVNAPRCEDPRWMLIVVTFLSTTIVSIYTTSRRLFFGSIFVSIYFCVALAADPPDYEEYASVLSWAFRGFLPAAFVALVIYHFCVRRCLASLDAPLEKTVLWLGGCWLGALSNFTLEKLPIQRLTLHDLQQPGAMLTLIVITLLLVVIVAFQAWAFRVEGRLLRYLGFYACLGLLLLALALMPGVDLRIHHYILALILLPGTALQTRPSLFYQGLLVGLFINGVARWGFDSIVQTPRDLYGDDFDTICPPIPIPIVDGSNTNITFSWSDIQSAYDGISVLVNDVERFRGFDSLGNDSFTWTRYKETQPEYFRFAYVRNGLFDVSSTGKSSKPATWELDGNWNPPPEP